ncbi:MAG: class I SAM-dependent methyltransferase [Alphaproteobacteria bacterium]|nr:class I SAM-dependent methyltransferase [Alphaproteobacteria bacterium]
MSALPQTDDTNYLRQVREQYENYPYPPVNPQNEKHKFTMPVTEAFDHLNHACFGGRRDFRKQFRSLVAGGGTGDSAIALAEQLRGTGNEVVYIDMSEASMKVAQERAEIRGLTNIRWIRDSLLNIPKLGLGKFDYINCSGVLHHLSNPDEGLKVLSEALADDGAMSIMVYAQYGRMAVYQMQEMLRIVNEGEANLQTQVDNAKIILNSMPHTNWFIHSSQMIRNEILGGDNAIYDLLLHTQDRAYTIPQLYEFLGKATLNLVELFSDDRVIGHRLYDASYYLTDPELIEKVSHWPVKEQQELAELLHSKIEKHTFYATKQLVTPPSPNDLAMVPHLGFNVYSEHAPLLEVIRTNAEETVTIRQESTGAIVTLKHTPHLPELFAAIDGKRPLGEIIKSVQQVSTSKPTTEQLIAEFENLFTPMRNALWMFLRHKDTAEVLHHDVFQARIPT